MNHKKGFTLIELLGVLILLGILAIIVFPIVSKTLRDSRKKAYDRSIENIMEASHMYVSQNKLGYDTKKKTIPLSTLKEEGLLEDKDIISPLDNEPITGCALYYWNIEDNQYDFEFNDNCEVSTTESCFAFDEYDGTIFGYSSDCPTDVSIPSKINGVEVKKIDASAFYNYEYYSSESKNYNRLTSVDFSNAKYLEEIGYNAFKNNEIVSVNFNGASNLKRIEKDSFASNNITTLDFSSLSNLEYLSGFSDNQLGNIIFGQLPNLKNIGEDAFRGNYYDKNSKLISIDLSGLTGLVGIAEGAFDSHNITSLDFSKLVNLESLDGFHHNNLTSITFGNLNKLTTIQPYAFSGYSDKIGNVSSIDLSGLTNLVNIGENAFSYLNIENVNISSLHKLENLSGFSNNKISVLDLSTLSSLKTIGYNAFSSNELNKIDFTGLTKLLRISDDAFSYNNITLLDLSPLTNLIYLSGFSNNQLTNVDLSKMPLLKSIGYNAFYKNKLTNINLTGLTQLSEINSGAFSDNSLTTINLSSLANLKILSGFANNRISTLDFTGLSSLISIDSNAFSDNQLTSLDLSNLTKLTRIGSNAFLRNELQSLDLSKSILLREIGYNAFSNNQLQSLNLNNLDNLLYMKSSAFANNQLVTLDLSGLSHLTELSNLLFANNLLTNVIIPNSILTIHNSTFNNNKNLKSITIDHEFNAVLNAPWGALNADINWLRSTTYSILMPEPISIRKGCSYNGKYYAGCTSTILSTEGSVTSYKLNSTLINGNVITIPNSDSTISEVTTIPAYILESLHPYDNNINQTYTQTVTGASRLLLTFNGETMFENNYDKLKIYDKNNYLIGTYTGNQLSGKQITVEGDTVKLILITDSSVSKYGFYVEVKAG